MYIEEGSVKSCIAKVGNKITLQQRCILLVKYYSSKFSDRCICVFCSDSILSSSLSSKDDNNIRNDSNSDYKY